MTFELTSERLQQIAVDCVTQFISKQASLNEAIAKEAMDLELNADQTKRVIEASNTIAYLRQLEKSADRTFEFDVADYNKVMTNMTMPDDMLKQAGKEADKAVSEDISRAKADIDQAAKDQARDNSEDSGKSSGKEEADDKGSASDKEGKSNPFAKSDNKDASESKDDKKESNPNPFTKSDKKEVPENKDDKKESKGNPFAKSEKTEEPSDKGNDTEEEKQEKRAMLMKGYFKAKATLEKMAYDEAQLYMEVIKTAGLVNKDPVALEKIAYVVDSADTDKTLKLCGIEKRAAEDVIFTDKELVDVKRMYSLYKQAGEFAEEKTQLEDFVARSETLLFKAPVDLEKQAFIGGLLARGAGLIAGGVGKMIGGAAKGLAQGAGNMASEMGAFGRASSAAGFKSTSDAVSSYDKIRSTQGAAAAKAQFGGRSPSLLVHRIGLGGALTATTGLGMEHKNNVKDI